MSVNTLPRKIHGKLNIVVEYYPRNGLLSISGADSIIPSDSLSAYLIIEKLETRARYFLGDAGFDSESLYKLCYDKGIQPTIKQKRYEGRYGKWRKKALVEFDQEVYRRYRSVVEGVFGGLAIRRSLFTRYKKESMRCKYIIAMAVVHNLNA